MWVSFFLKEKDFGLKPVKGDISSDKGRAQVVNESLYAMGDDREEVERGVIKTKGGVRFGIGK